MSPRKRIKEVWKEISDYEGFYEVSSRGRVRSVDRILDTTAGPRRILLIGLAYPRLMCLVW